MRRQDDPASPSNAVDPFGLVSPGECLFSLPMSPRCISPRGEAGLLLARVALLDAAGDVADGADGDAVGRGA